MSNIVEVTNLSFGYGPRRAVLREITFGLPRGAFLGIAGPNGAGKSTLLNLLAGRLRSAPGTISIDGKPMESYDDDALSRRVAVVRQEFVPVFGFSVAETVMMARTTHFGRLGFETEEDRMIVADAMKATETTRFASRSLDSLSGGERQLVFVARALAQQTEILLLDEPTNFLDLKHQVGVYDLLKSIQVEQGKTVVAVTHEINLAAQYCDQALLLDGDGRCEYGSVADVLNRENIERVFDVRIELGKVGRRKLFVPLGKFTQEDR